MILVEGRTFLDGVVQDFRYCRLARIDLTVVDWSLQNFMCQFAQQVNSLLFFLGKIENYAVKIKLPRLDNRPMKSFDDLILIL